MTGKTVHFEGNSDILIVICCLSKPIGAAQTKRDKIENHFHHSTFPLSYMRCAIVAIKEEKVINCPCAKYGRHLTFTLFQRCKETGEVIIH